MIHMMKKAKWHSAVPIRAPALSMNTGGPIHVIDFYILLIM